jgi:hypothetical protein
MAAETESGTSRGWKALRDGAARLSLPIFATVVSAVLIAYFVTSRQDAQHLQHERDLQTKALIANDMSEASVRLIIAAENRTKALVRSGQSPSQSDSTARSLAEFYAASAFIRAKLQAYYDDETLATRWRRYTNAVGAFLDLGTAPPKFESRPDLFNEIRRGFLGADDTSNAALKLVHFNTLENTKNRFEYLRNYGLLGDALIDRGAELTRDALD